MCVFTYSVERRPITYVQLAEIDERWKCFCFQLFHRQVDKFKLFEATQGLERRRRHFLKQIVACQVKICEEKPRQVVKHDSTNSYYVCLQSSYL